MTSAGIHFANAQVSRLISLQTDGQNTKIKPKHAQFVLTVVF